MIFSFTETERQEARKALNDLKTAVLIDVLHLDIIVAILDTFLKRHLWR